MDERQKREYQTVALGALLHDIGKTGDEDEDGRRHRQGCF